MGFHVIHIAPGLSDRDSVRAVAAGPAYVAASASYPDLLALAGFTELEEVDVTDQWRVTAAAWLDESAHAAEELKEIFGIEEYRQAQQEREETLAAIDSGLLRRSLLVASTT